ncbi:MAG: VOC family protein [Dehalococcoidia bacterium]
MAEDMGIKRLDHVCWAVRNLNDALPMLTELMGMKLVAKWQSEEQGFSGASLELPGGTAHFELLEPLGEDSYLHRFLDERGPGLHHVTFEVESVQAAAEAVKNYGIEPFGGVRQSHSGFETYIHPRDSGGVLFQFYWDDPKHIHEHDHEHDSPK